MFLNGTDGNGWPVLINSAMVHRIGIEYNQDPDRSEGQSFHVTIVARTAHYAATIWEQYDSPCRYEECIAEACNRTREIGRKLNKED